VNDVLSRLARTLNPIIGLVIAIGGGTAGGAMSNGPIGAIVGTVVGAALGIGISGIIAALSTLDARLAQQSAEAPVEAPRARAAVATSPVMLPGYASSSHAMNGHAASIAIAAVPNAAAAMGLDQSAVVSNIVDTTIPREAAISPMTIESTETEAQLLAGGKFAEYHLAKAKRLFAAKDFKEAAYQCAASISHGDLPEAVTLRKAAKDAMAVTK
jgi:hypothetical protein